MVELQFKAICRLNRFLALVLAALSLASLWHHNGDLLQIGLLTGAVLLHFSFLVGNEFCLKMLKRLREAELQTITHLSLFVPIVYAVYAAVNYWLTGSYLVYLLGFFAVLQAQFLGQARLSIGLVIFGMVLYAIGLPLGLPHAVALDSGSLFLTAAVLGSSLFAYGGMVLNLVQSHNSQLGKLQSMAATDVLTGLTNRRQFNVRLHEEIARARRHETPVSLALFDLDDFKRLNDFYGHPVGDRILRELGKLVRQNIRESDLPSRYGGEEFAIILPETSESEAYELLERIRLLVAQTVFCLPDNPLTVTISVGVAQLDSRRQTAFELVEAADKALYEAKKQGKNQVVRASSLMTRMLLDKTAESNILKNRFF